MSPSPHVDDSALPMESYKSMLRPDWTITRDMHEFEVWLLDSLKYRPKHLMPNLQLHPLHYIFVDPNVQLIRNAWQKAKGVI